MSQPPPLKKARGGGLLAFGFSAASKAGKSGGVEEPSEKAKSPHDQANEASSTEIPSTKGSSQASEKETAKAFVTASVKGKAALAKVSLASTATGGSLPPLLGGELMHSTKAASAKKRDWVRHAPDKTRDLERAYCSTDGSSTGWHAAVFVAAHGTTAHLRARWRDHQGSNNVGAEAFGFALGVLTVLPSCVSCVFLADFLNALAWDVGGAKYKHPAIIEAFDGPDGVNACRRRNGHKPREVEWSHVHHPGHQTDDSWFTLLNQVADNLASCKEDVDVTVPLAELRNFTVQGKGGVEACKRAVAGFREEGGGKGEKEEEGKEEA